MAIRMIRVALLSRWHVHADDYAREAIAHPDLQVEMVWDEDPDRGRRWANELDVAFEADIDQVCSSPDIDAVIITTPTDQHKKVMLKACQYQKHIFSEKVLAFTIEDCQEIIKQAEDAGIKLMLSLPRLTEKEFLQADHALNEGWLGDLSMIRCRLAHNGAVAPAGKEAGWLPKRFFNKAQTGGGALIDLGAHPIYLTNRLAKDPKAVYARMQPQVSKDVDDAAVVTIEYASGALGVVETGFLSYSSPFQLELYGTEGVLLAEEGRIRLKSIHYGDNQWIEIDEQLPVVATPMEQWVNAIQTDEPTFITAQDMMQLTMINQAARHSHQEGKRIEVSDIK